MADDNLVVREQRQTNCFRDRMGNSQVQPRDGDLSHRAHLHVIMGEYLWICDGGGDK